MHKYLWSGTFLAHLVAAYPIPVTHRSVNATLPVMLALRESSQIIPAVMLAGATQLAVQVPPDNSVHFASDTLCLDVAASAVGSCSLTNIDHIAATAGFTCVFLGAAGWIGSQDGDNGNGWLKVGPPQPLAALTCQPN